MTDNECKGSFESSLVIDMTYVLSGPFGAQFLCNVGVRIIKVELSGRGDDTRTFGPYVDKQSLYYSFINRGKESVVLDLKNDHDKSISMNMLKQADISAGNSRSDATKKLGSPRERLQEIDPCLIYASLSGSGYTGPLKDVPAYDIIIQAVSGTMAEIGHPDAPLVRIGTSLADFCGGIHLFSGIVSAPYGCEKNQRGTHVDIATFGVTLSFLEHGLAVYIATGKPSQRLGNRHPCMAPFDVSDTQDGPIMICHGNDKLFSALYQALELIELVNDPRLSSNILHVHNQIILKERTEWTLKTQVAEVQLVRIHKISVPATPLLSVTEAINLSQTQARNMLIEAGGIMIPDNPVKISGCTDPRVMPGAAMFNQHGGQICQEFSS